MAIGPVGLLLVVLGVLFGIRSTSQPSGSEGKSATAGGIKQAGQPTGVDKSESPGLDLLKPYAEFRGYHDGFGACTKDGTAGRQLGELLAFDAWQQRVCPKFLIVSVPDPIDSRIGYLFDPILDAVQLAVEAQQVGNKRGENWKLDRFWLPWRPLGQTLHDAAELKPVPVPRTRTAEWLHESHPGLLLFRGPGQEKKPRPLLLVFLVGETPTFGVAKEALSECLETIGRYHAYSREQLQRIVGSFGFAIPNAGLALLGLQPVNLRIVGPFFTGAQASYSLTVKQFLEIWRRELPGQEWNFHFRSGSADSIKVKMLKHDAVGNAQNGKVQFDATVVPTKPVLAELFHFLHDQNGGPLYNVALLTESDTGYGQSIADALWDCSSRSSDGRVNKKFFAKMPMVMKFPFHISELAAVSKTSEQRSMQGSSELIHPSSRMSIPFGEAGASRETPPSLAPDMANVTGEFVLSKIFETISREQFRYIGIVATDPRDTIFLAGQIRAYCPDVQIFTVGASLLLSHPRYSHETSGMILASSYPLFSMAQRWYEPMSGESRRQQFSCQEEEGVYNAVLSLLSGTDENLKGLYDYGPPFDGMKDLEWSRLQRLHAAGCRRPDLVEKRPGVWISVEKRPGVWISTIGARGLWPVKFIEKVDDKHYTFRYQQPAPPDPFDRRYFALAPQVTWAWCAVVVGLSMVVWLLFWHHAWLARPPVGKQVAVGLWGFEHLCPIRNEGVGTNIPGCDLRLISQVKEVSDVPREGKDLIIVAVVDNVLHFRIFDDDGKMVVDTDEKRLTKKARQIVELRKQLACLWASNNLTESEKDRIICDVTSIVGHSLPRPEIYVCVGLLALLVTYIYVVLQPCWVAFTDIPWPALLVRQWWQAATPDDLWNLGVLWFVFYVGLATLLALVSTIVLRKMLWLRPVTLRIRLPLHPVTLRIRLPLRPIILSICLIMVPTVFALPPLFWRCWVPWCGQGTNRLLFFERAVNIISGVSPFGPVVLLSLIFGLWVWCQLRLMYLAWKFWGPREKESDRVIALRLHKPARQGAKQRLDRLRRLGDHVEGSVRDLWFMDPQLRFWVFITALPLATVALIRILEGAVPTVDFPGWWWTRAILFLIWFLGLTVLLALCRFLLAWCALSRLLTKLMELPMAPAFDRIPPMFSRSFGRYLDRVRPRYDMLKIPVQQWTVVAQGLVDVSNELRYFYLLNNIEGQDSSKEDPFDQIFEAIANPTGKRHITNRKASAAEVIQKIHRCEEKKAGAIESADPIGLAESFTWNRLRNAACGCIDLLDVYWTTTSPADGYAEPRANDTGKAEAPGPSPSLSEAARRWFRSAEDLLAIELVCFVSRCTVPLKMLATYMAVAPILLLLTVWTYPFQPHRFLEVTLWSLFLAVVTGVMWVYVSMERDEFLSRVSKTTPNAVQFDRQFFAIILTYVVPLLGFMVAQFPFVSDALNQWFEPLGRILR